MGQGWLGRDEGSTHACQMASSQLQKQTVKAMDDKEGSQMLSGVRQQDSGFSSSSSSSVAAEEEEVQGRSLWRGEEKPQVGGLKVTFYSVSDMIRDCSLELDLDSRLLTEDLTECISTSFIEECSELCQESPESGTNPASCHLTREQTPLSSGLDSMDCPLKVSQHSPGTATLALTGERTPLDSWLAEVRGLHESECSIMLQSKPLRCV